MLLQNSFLCHLDVLVPDWLILMLNVTKIPDNLENSRFFVGGAKKSNF